MNRFGKGINGKNIVGTIGICEVECELMLAVLGGLAAVGSEYDDDILDQERKFYSLKRAHTDTNAHAHHLISNREDC